MNDVKYVLAMKPYARSNDFCFVSALKHEFAGKKEVVGYGSLKEALKFDDITSAIKALDEMPAWAEGKHQIIATSFTGIYWSVDCYLLLIARAAIRFHEVGEPDEWKTYFDFCHANILHRMEKEGIVFDRNDYQCGFITNERKMHFVSRQEAADIAYYAKQIKKRKPQLFSEDLWDKNGCSLTGISVLNYSEENVNG